MSTYSIVDINGYIEAIKTEAASNVSFLYSEKDLVELITTSQILSVVESFALGFDENDNYIIDDDTHFDILEEIESWIYEVTLAKLAGSNKIECAWDDALNTMVFWSLKSDIYNDPDTNYSAKDGDRQN